MSNFLTRLIINVNLHGPMKTGVQLFSITLPVFVKAKSLDAVFYFRCWMQFYTAAYDLFLIQPFLNHPENANVQMHIVHIEMHMQDDGCIPE